MVAFVSSANLVLSLCVNAATHRALGRVLTRALHNGSGGERGRIALHDGAPASRVLRRLRC